MGKVTMLAEPPRRVDPRHDTRPLFSAGGLAATWAAGIGLAVLVILTLIGWIAAPHSSVGQDLPSVFRTAVQVWLVAHQTGFEIAGGSIGLLPLGLVVLPGLLIYRSGRWLARGCELPRLRHAGQAALAIAGPYAAIAGTLALIARTPSVQPSVFQALMAGFIVAFVAAGLGVTRELAASKNIPWSRLLALIPERPRSIVAGTVAAMAVLLFFATALFLIAYAWHLPQAVEITNGLAPGPIGGALLVLLQFVYLPNAVIFAMAYAIGPGFAVGADTIVAPTGVVLGALPQFPMLAALPESGPAPAFSLLALIAPFAAGAVGGVFT
ncbi:MAG: cell division protein PerM, partial [Stackebrandtia sp.]